MRAGNRYGMRMLLTGLLFGAGLSLGACVGVESEVEAPPIEVAEGDAAAADEAALAEGEQDATAEEAESSEGDVETGSGVSKEWLQAEGLTERALGNLTYEVDGSEVPLVDGGFQERPMPDSATFIANYTLGPWQAFGDLDGDGLDDAVVVLINAPGGSGVFTYLAAVVAGEAGPVNASTVTLGDRPQIDSVTIADGLVTVAGKTHGEDDPMCCPSQDFAWVYALEEGELVKEASEMVDDAGEEDAAGDDEAVDGEGGSDEAMTDERPEALVVASGAWDGTECLWAGEGATLAFDGQRVGYTCTMTEEGEVVLLDEPVDNGDGSYTIELGLVLRNAADDGFELGETETVVVTAVE